MVKRFLVFSLTVSWVIALAGIAHAALRVVTTTPSLAAIAKEVGGADADVTSIALPTQDPHFVDARPHLALQLARAELLVVVGLGLEAGWLPVLQTGSRNGQIQNGGRGYLDCSAFVRLLDVATGPVDRSMGDIHPAGNPHYLFDPRAARAVAKGMAERMGALAPAHADAYRDRSRRFAERLQTSIDAWEKKLVQLRGRKVVTYHRSFSYLADWLGLTVLDHLEPRPGIPPTPKHVAGVVARAKQSKVQLLLQEQFYPDNLSDLAAKKMGARLVRVPSGPDFRAGETYVAHIDGIVRQLARAAGSP